MARRSGRPYGLRRRVYAVNRLGARLQLRRQRPDRPDYLLVGKDLLGRTVQIEGDAGFIRRMLREIRADRGSETAAGADTYSEGSSSDTRRTRAANRPQGPAETPPECHERAGTTGQDADQITEGGTRL